ncbi:MAG: hypothetical protein JW862_14960, partial [Anaerolineales bacterium]|nr:hypothetical protein [Anaerolineales bacterium]
MMKRNGFLYLSVVFVLIFVFTTEGLAQTVEPPGQEVGVSVDLETLAPESEIQGDSPAFSGGPAYDSGWVALGLDQTKVLYHRLGGNVDHYVVDMQYRGDSSNGVNQRYYGGADFGSKPPAGASADDRVGAYWRSLTTSSITVYRRPEDIYADFVRVRIWVDSQPASADKY